LNKKTALRWIQIADRDLDVAKLLPEGHADSSAYHFQQAAEKYLKGFLAAHQVPLRKSHNISTLLLEASKLDTEFLSLSSEIDLDVITEFATHYRYPNEEEEEFPTQEELRQACSFCEKTKAMVEAKVIAGEDAAEDHPSRICGDSET